MLMNLLKKFFVRNKSKSAEKMKNQAVLHGMLRGIEEFKKSDPLIGAKVAGREICQRLINALKTEEGVHIESLLCALGSLAGYSCQAQLRALSIKNGEHEESRLVIIKTENNEKYFFGDSLNQALAESDHSIWNLAAGGAQQAGCNHLPDVIEIFRHVSKVVGSKDFGILRLPVEHQPHHKPIEYLTAFWQNVLPILTDFCQQSSEWHIAFGIEIQKIILQGKSVLDPCTCLKIVMESAIQMSKVDLANARCVN